MFLIFERVLSALASLATITSFIFEIAQKIKTLQKDGRRDRN